MRILTFFVFLNTGICKIFQVLCYHLKIYLKKFKIILLRMVDSVQRVKKIDIHCHAVTESLIPFGNGAYFPTPDDMRKAYDVLGVERAVLLPLIDNISCPQPQSLTDTLKMVKEYPNTIGWWFCNIDPAILYDSEDTDLSYFLLKLKELGAKGVGEVTRNLPFDHPLMFNLFKHCEKCEMPLLFHVGRQGGYGIIDQNGLVLLEKALKAFPYLIFIGHSTCFWNEISGDCGEKPLGEYHLGPVKEGGRVVELMRKYKNLYCDISAGSGYFALTRDVEFTYKFLEEFQDRIYYGADICVKDCYDLPLMKMSEFLDEAMENGKISYECYVKICRENALKLLGERDE